MTQHIGGAINLSHHCPVKHYRILWRLASVGKALVLLQGIEPFFFFCVCNVWEWLDYVFCSKVFVFHMLRELRECLPCPVTWKMLPTKKSAFFVCVCVYVPI